MSKTMRYNPVRPPYAADYYSKKHMASSGHYLASQAALRILDAGGNAVDAGVAGGLVLGVVQCEYTHFAGVAPIMIYLAEKRQVVTLSGVGCWPKAASAQYFIDHHQGRIPSGFKRAVVPAAPDAWLTALEEHGTMSFSEVAAQAIEYATEGFPVSRLMTDIIVERSEEFLAWEENTRLFMPDGKAPQPGDIFKLPDMARAMRYMVDEEKAAAGKGRAAGIDAARDAFYRGDIARAIAAHHRENDGWLTEDDLAQFRVGREDPVQVSFKGVDVFTCGPWCQGPVLGQALRLLESDRLDQMTHNSVEYIHTVVEALKLSFADRDAYFTDPRFGHVPMDELLSDAYIDERRRLIDPAVAAPGMPPAGKLERRNAVSSTPKPASVWQEPELDTSYICVIDRDGNVFSATPSDGCLTGPIVPGLGLNPSNRGSQSWTDPNHPSCLAPGKRPRLTPSPALAICGDEWLMPLGSPGNDVQAQAMIQVFLNVVVFGMRVDEAIAQPRFASYSFPATSEPHDYHPGRLSIEKRVGQEVMGGLAALGHKIVSWPEWEWRAGSVCAIKSDRISGVMEGGADARRPGGVAAG